MTATRPPPVDSLLRVGPEAFDGRRLLRPGVWAVAFLADWCPYCRQFAPDFARLAGPGRELAVADLSDDDGPLWERFEVEIVPSVIVFRDGEAVLRIDGRPMEGLRSEDLQRVDRVLGGT